MILSTGSRTDIPAFYSEWFCRRVREGFVLVRNPYYPSQVTRYRISPDAVDLLLFCTKNPAPMLPRLGEIGAYAQYWFVTVTPYGREIEPRVPDKREVLASVRELGRRFGKRAVGWRYDPVFVTEKYSVEYHKDAFRRMAETIDGAAEQAVVSFIDLYEKTKRNFPEVRAVAPEEQAELVQSFAATAKEHGMTLRLCAENPELARYGADVSGCVTAPILERAAGMRLNIPRTNRPRAACDCILGSDIGAYNTCPHLCRYCYANYDRETVRRNVARHDPTSPFLIGGPEEGDVVTEAKQVLWGEGQMMMGV